MHEEQRITQKEVDELLGDYLEVGNSPSMIFNGDFGRQAIASHLEHDTRRRATPWAVPTLAFLLGVLATLVVGGFLGALL